MNCDSKFQYVIYTSSDGCRRMEEAVKAIPESSDLCKKIVLGLDVEDIPGKLFFALFFADIH